MIAVLLRGTLLAHLVMINIKLMDIGEIDHKQFLDDIKTFRNERIFEHKDIYTRYIYIYK